MIAEIRDRWTKAMRSEEYEQGDRALNRSGWFCPLGILCNLHSKETGTEWESHNNPQEVDEELRYLGSDDFLPLDVIKWAGLESKDPLLSIHGVPRSISVLSDSDEFSFDEIAQLIEEQF